MDDKKVYVPTTLEEYNKALGVKEGQAPAIRSLDNMEYEVGELQRIEKMAFDDAIKDEDFGGYEMQVLMSADMLLIMQAINDCGFSGGVYGYAMGLLDKLRRQLPLTDITEEDFKPSEFGDDPNEYLCTRVENYIHAKKQPDGSLGEFRMYGCEHFCPMYHGSYTQGGKGFPVLPHNKAFLIPNTSSRTFKSLPIHTNEVNATFMNQNVFQYYLREAYGDAYIMAGAEDALRNQDLVWNKVSIDTTTERYIDEHFHDSIVESAKHMYIILYRGHILITSIMGDEAKDITIHAAIQLEGTYDGKDNVAEGINFMRGMHPQTYGINKNGSFSNQTTFWYALVPYTAKYISENDIYGDNAQIILPIANERCDGGVYNSLILDSLPDYLDKCNADLFSINFSTAEFVYIPDDGVDAYCLPVAKFVRKPDEDQTKFDDECLKAAVEMPWGKNLKTLIVKMLDEGIDEYGDWIDDLRHEASGYIRLRRENAKKQDNLTAPCVDGPDNGREDACASSGCEAACMDD